MPSDATLKSGSSVKKDKDPKVSKLVIEKPRTLSACPVQTRPKILPLIKKTPHRRTKLKKVMVHPTEESSESRIILPKLCTNRLSQQRVEAGEPFHGFQEPEDEGCQDIVASALKCLKNVREAEETKVRNSHAVGPSACRFEYEIPSAEFSYHDFKPPEEKEDEPSHALQQWELWMERRKRLQNYLSKKLDRSPCDLQIQQSDKRRKVVEDKLLFHYAKIPEPDKEMGHPYQWRPDMRLAPKCKCVECSDGCPQYLAVRTKSYDGIVPVMEFVGIPLDIQKEKGLVCGDVSKSVNSASKLWKESSYRKERSEYYQKQLHKMKPHEIEMNDLIVVGTGIPHEEENASTAPCEPDIPEIRVTEPEDAREEQIPCDDRKSIFCLKINEKEIKYEIGRDSHQHEHRNESYTWEVDFGSNTAGTLVERTLRVENKGTVSVTYEWASIKLKQMQSLEPLTPKHHEPWFFFNKNSGIFVPGEVYNLKFYHFSKKSGIRTETWFLRTKPELFKNPENGRVVLMAVASDASSESETQALESLIQKRVAQSNVKYILQRILFTAANPTLGLSQIEYRSVFQTKDLFEYHNPKHYYHSMVVDDLYQLFTEVFSYRQPDWDLSIDSLLEGVFKYKTGKEKDDYLCRISECGKKLLRPNHVFKKKDEKHRMIYGVLCKMANSMEEDCQYIASCLSQKRNEPEEECEEETIISNLKSEEETEFNPGETFYEIPPTNLPYLYSMIYLKVYYRLCEAVEEMVGIIETRNFFRPWK